MKFPDYFALPENAVNFCIGGLFFSLLIASVQNLLNIGEFGDEGIFDWNVLKHAYYGFPRSNFTDACFSKKAVLVSNIFRLLLLVYGLLHLSAIPGWLIFLVLAVSLFIYYRATIQATGADQMNNILLVLLLGYKWLPYGNFKIVYIFPDHHSGHHLLFNIRHIQIACKRLAQRIDAQGHPADEHLQHQPCKKINQAIRFTGDQIRQSLDYPMGIIIYVRATNEQLGFMRVPHFRRYFSYRQCDHHGLNTFVYTFLATYPCIIFTQLYFFKHLPIG